MRLEFDCLFEIRVLCIAEMFLHFFFFFGFGDVSFDIYISFSVAVLEIVIRYTSTN